MSSPQHAPGPSPGRGGVPPGHTYRRPHPRHAARPEEAYSLHLWNHLWVDPRRRDFCHFHGGLLTVDYVAHARTTYARLARRFLPAGEAGSRRRYWRQALAAFAAAPAHATLSAIGIEPASVRRLLP